MRKNIVLRIYEKMIQDNITAPARVWKLFLIFSLIGLAVGPALFG